MTSDGDTLFDIRNTYYLGAYQQCILHAQETKTKTDEELAVKNSYLYRAYISLQKTSIPLSEIDASAPPSLKAVRRFADYIANAGNRKSIVQELTKEYENALVPNDDICYLMNGLIFMHEDNVDDALRLLSKGTSLECQAAVIQCLLKISRVDLAQKHVKAMHEIDEYSTVSQLALAWVNVATGKDKLKDAFYIFQELIDKYGSTPLLLVSQAACLMQQQKYEDAEKLLHEAQQQNVNYPNALIGMVGVTQFLGKSFEVTNRYINQLKADYPNHAWTKDYAAKEREFDILAAENATESVA